MARTSLYPSLAFMLACVMASPAHAAEIRCVESNPAQGSSAEVLVDDVPLLHTAQLFPAPAGPMPEDTHQQVTLLFAGLQSALRGSQTDLQHVVKLNFYVPSAQTAKAVREELARIFSKEHRPAISFVVTPLPVKGALVALDAVAAAPKVAADKVSGDKIAAILPAGERIYISGQAEPGTLREATRKTLESLTASLKHCGRADADVVQLKCFLTPMASAAEVQDEIAAYYGKRRVPPISLVEWKSTAPIEIELVAWGGPAKDVPAEPLEFLTPPELKKSPLYSRIARIHGGGTVYFSDIFGPADGDAEGQLKSSFERLKLLCEKSGTDLKHLVKATYYVTDDEASKAHNEIRPKYYDPQRPPAASKALVAGTGREGVRYTMDMIAVPSSRGTPATPAERAAGLGEQECADGWLSLFDGATTMGWKDAKVENGLLSGGRTSIRFGNCELRGQFQGEGTLLVGGKEIKLAGGPPLVLKETGAKGEIRLSEGVAVKALYVRPRALQALLNGKDLTGWKLVQRKAVEGKEPAWRIEDGVLRAVGGPEALEYTERQFGDFALQIDVRTRAVHSNGGVFFRAIPGDFMNGYEAQLHNRCLENDPARTFRYCTGGIDDRQDARRQVARDFVPFRMTIIADGPQIATWVNGVQVADFRDDRPEHDNPREGRRLKPGALQLQAHDPATDYEVRQVLVAAWE